MKNDYLKSVSLSSGKSSKKSRLIKKSFFIESECQDRDDERNLRSDIRKTLYSYVHSFVKNSKLDDDEIKKFLDFYKKVYEKNDFSVQSVYDGGDDLMKENIKKMLSFIAPKDIKENKPKNK